MVIFFDLIFQTLYFLGDALAALHVVPEALLLGLDLQLGKLLPGGLDIQRLLQLLQRRLQRQQLLFISIVFNDSHGQFLLLHISLAFLLYPN